MFRRLRYYFETRGAGRTGAIPPPAQRTWVHPSELPGSFDRAALPPARTTGSRRFKTVVASAASALLAMGGAMLVLPSATQPAGASIGPHVATSIDALPSSDRSTTGSLLALAIFEGQHLGTASAMVLPPGDLAVTTTPIPRGASVMGRVLGQQPMALRVVGTDRRLGVTVLWLPSSVPVTPTAPLNPAVATDGAPTALTALAAVRGTATAAQVDYASAYLSSNASAATVGPSVIAVTHGTSLVGDIAGTVVVDAQGRAVAAQVPALGSTTFVSATFLQLLAQRIVLGNPSDHGWLQLEGAPSSVGAAKVVGVTYRGVTWGRILPGDTILAVNSVRVRTMADVGSILYTSTPGQPVDLTVLRDGRTLVVDVVLAASPVGSGSVAGVPPNGFEGLLGDLLKAMGGAPSTAWFEAAKGLALSVVADEHEGFNPDPVARIRLEELSRVVAMHLGEVTGSTTDDRVEPVTRAAWAVAALTSWRPRLEPLVAAAAAPPPVHDEGGGDADASAAVLARFAASMGPMFVGLQVGSTAGHLAEDALGTSAFPLPWPAQDHALVVVRNVAAFAEDWSLDDDAVTAFTVARELAARAAYEHESVARRVEALLATATEAQMAAQRTLLERLTDADSPEGLAALLGDPEALVEGLSGLEPQTGGPAHDALNAAVTALSAYFDEVARVVAARVVGDATRLSEAWHRHRAGDSKGAEAAASLFGVDLSRERVELGAAFVAGVLERDGFEALSRLVTRPDALPTPAEIVAPGLWLARTSLPELDGPDEPVG